MTVLRRLNSINQEPFSVSNSSDHQKHNQFSSPELTTAKDDHGYRRSDDLISKIDRSFVLLEKKRSKVFEVATDQESGGSSSTEEMESPESVAKVGQWQTVACLHSQIRRIREEETRLNEDIGERFGSAWNYDDNYHHHRMASAMNVMIFVRPILPSSPLSGKSTVRALH